MPDASHSAPKVKPKSQNYRARAMSELLLLQRLLIEKAQTQGLKAVSLAAVARAWSELEERKRIMRNVPLPEALLRLDPAEFAKRLKQRRLPTSEPPPTAFIEVQPETGEEKGIS